MNGSHVLLLYNYVEDILERRGPFREAHLAHLRAAKDEGLVVGAGPLGDPPVGAAILVRGDDPTVAGRLAAGDPYVINGLVTSWTADLWNAIV